ncbi:MAG: hypothetical protein MI924_18685 [Chloroflexales bacterium]|nr:hypothetical protein [Chloroflexales bacterium]
MKEQSNRHDSHAWANLTPDQILTTLAYELYNPVSLLGNQLKRLTDDEDPITEDDYEAIFEQMHAAVRQLSKTVVNLKLYTQDRSQAPKE